MFYIPSLSSIECADLSVVSIVSFGKQNSWVWSQCYYSWLISMSFEGKCNYLQVGVLCFVLSWSEVSHVVIVVVNCACWLSYLMKLLDTSISKLPVSNWWLSVLHSGDSVLYCAGIYLKTLPVCTEKFRCVWVIMICHRGHLFSLLTLQVSVCWCDVTKLLTHHVIRLLTFAARYKN